MGCTSSTDAKKSSPAGKQRIIWLAGASSAGKTFTGDYLATRGYHHIDGDMGNQSDAEDMKKMWADISGAMRKFMAKEELTEEEWKPYFSFLVTQIKEGVKTGKNVVISFAACDMFKENAWLKQEIPGIEFFILDVDMEEIVRRSMPRNAAFMIAAGTTVEE